MIASICSPLGVIDVGDAGFEITWERNVNTSSINICSLGFIAQVTVDYEANTKSHRGHFKGNCN